MFKNIKELLLKLKSIPFSTYKKWFLWTFLGGILFCGLFYLSIYWGLWGKIPGEQELGDLKQNEATEIFASEGELIGKYYIFDRQPVLYKELPQHLIDALVATEDVR